MAKKPVEANDTTRSSTPSGPSNQEIKDLVTSLNSRVDTLEKKLGAMNEKMNAMPTALQGNGVASRLAADNAGNPPHINTAKSDPEAGFVNDHAIQDFRKAMVLYEGQRYPEAVLAFSSFVEKYPDHPLAGSAQFYAGECYTRQREYKLAIEEYQHVLTSYDRSSHIAETLKELADAEDALKRHAVAARHRQLLTSLFPQSPFATISADTAKAQPEGEAEAEPAETVPVTPSSDISAINKPDAPKPSQIDAPPVTAPIGGESPTLEQRTRAAIESINPTEPPGGPKGN